MKKMMMAFAAVAMMTMSGNAMAASTTKAPETYENEQTRLADSFETRTLVHLNGSEMNKFEYTLDGEGHVSTKTMYRYDSNTNSWIPVMMYRASYGDDCNTLSFAAWNKQDNSFSNHAMKTSYSKSECPVLISLPDCLDY